MEENKLITLGNKAEIIDYNLNTQYGQTKKIVITAKHIFQNLDNQDIETYLNEYVTSDTESEEKTYEIFQEELKKDLNLSNQFYKELSESIPQLSASLMDIQLKDYSFMNSVNNAKFNVTLRTECFTINSYLHEKNTLLAGVKNVLLKYLKYSGNCARKQKIKEFQVEIYEFDEVYKRVFIKKEGDKLLLYSTFGFPKENQISMEFGGEIYTTQTNQFFFYPNKQKSVILKDHTKLNENELKEFEKILTNQELAEINKRTKIIDDAEIELYINPKNQYRIIHVQTIQNGVEMSNKDAVYIHKSTKNYNKISLLTYRDNLEEQYPNPIYLLLRTPEEIQRLLEKPNLAGKLDGIVYTYNFYNQFLETLGKMYDIDIIFYKNPLQKNLDLEFNKQTLEFNTKIGTSEENPFQNILSSQNKAKDELLEKLKRMDLKTNEDVGKRREEAAAISSLATGIMASKESSMSRQTGGGIGSSPIKSNNGAFGTATKKTALGMLASTVIQTLDPKESRPTMRKSEPQPAPQQPIPQAQPIEEMPQERMEPQPMPQEQYMPPQYSQPAQQPQQQIFAPEKIVVPEPRIEIIPELEPVKKEVQKTLNIIPQEILEKYEKVLATTIITSPKITSNRNIFADNVTLHNVKENSNLFYITTTKESMQDPKINYVLPMSLNTQDVKNCFLLINNIEEFFQIDETQNVRYFLNLSYIDDKIKENFVKFAIDKLKKISVIVNKENLKVLENYINRIENIFIKNAETEEDYTQAKDEVLSYEKKFLLNNLEVTK